MVFCFRRPSPSLFLLGFMLVSVSCNSPANPYGTAFGVSKLFSDGMVAQRDAGFPVWGTASPGTVVTVAIGEETVDARAAAEGQWLARLSPRAAGGPHTLTIATPDSQVVVDNIVFGDVWIASGQSNMEWIVANSNDAQAEIAGANDPMIRQYKVPLGWSFEPQPELEGGNWHAADPEHVGDFSAVAYFFAREIRKHVDVPIGIINTSWGGSRIEPWMSLAALGMTREDRLAMEAAELASMDELRQRVAERIGTLPETDPGLVDGVAHWADPNLDTGDWSDIQVPGLWEQAGYQGLDGIAWYRTTFELTENERSTGSVRIGVGQIDDSDITWVNGIEVGRTEMRYNQTREYAVPDAALVAGTNVVAVRAEDTGGGGGIYGPADDLWVETAGGRQSLAGSWRFRVGEANINLDSRRNQMPTLLYNQMIHPLLHQPVTGFLWYQGESNAGGEDAIAYAEQFKTMIQSWRDLFGVPDAPFLYVQLASFMAPQSVPAEGGWAVLRESQRAALELPAVAEAVTIDIGEAEDIHPRNKQDVGLRLALAARHLAYGEDLVYSGPEYASHSVEGDQIVLEFEHVGSGLVARGGPLGGFAIAGADGAFVWAEAEIKGSTVVVSSPAIYNPVAVRYAWGNNPDKANLFNLEGLPASPFRTDG